ncbi:hypothetical protein G6F22_017085 [Rhizopus arrhizus]|nr:hypothetical protein G6F22_017085 [Rhizopus arrhizus]KAG0921340.1 hypothetical protein G6F32_015149 [Rhizopus arrhizus]
MKEQNNSSNRRLLPHGSAQGYQSEQQADRHAEAAYCQKSEAPACMHPQQGPKRSDCQRQQPHRVQLQFLAETLELLDVTSCLEHAARCVDGQSLLCCIDFRLATKGTRLPWWPFHIAYN